MVARSKLDAIENRIERLHRQRFKPPLMRWIETQDTERLAILRARLEAGQDLVTAMKGLTDEQ